MALLYVSEEFEQPEQFAEDKVHKPRLLVPQDADLWCEPQYLVEQGVPAEKILETAERRHADLIVLGAQPSRRQASHLNAGTVHKVVSEANCPVLTVHG